MSIAHVVPDLRVDEGQALRAVAQALELRQDAVAERLGGDAGAVGHERLRSTLTQARGLQAQYAPQIEQQARTVDVGRIVFGHGTFRPRVSPA